MIDIAPECEKNGCEWGDTQICPLYSKCMKKAFRDAARKIVAEKAEAFLRQGKDR